MADGAPVGGDAVPAQWLPYLERPLRDGRALDQRVVREALAVLRARFLPGSGVGPDGALSPDPIAWERIGTPNGGVTLASTRGAWGVRFSKSRPDRAAILARRAAWATCAVAILAFAACLVTLITAERGGPWFLAGLAGLCAMAMGIGLANAAPGSRWRRRRWEARATRVLEAPGNGRAPRA